MDSILNLLGIARKAGRLEVGEEPVGAAARAHQAKLILTAADGAENSLRRAAHFAQVGKALCLSTPYTKGELGGAAGHSACTMVALTDVGLASAIAQKLSAHIPDCCGQAVEQLKIEAGRALQRQKERRAHERNLQKRNKKPWASPPREGKQEGMPPTQERGAKPFVPKGKLTIKKRP